MGVLRNPGPMTRIPCLRDPPERCAGHLAQLVEHYVHIVGVAGSSPAVATVEEGPVGRVSLAGPSFVFLAERPGPVAGPRMGILRPLPSPRDHGRIRTRNPGHARNRPSCRR